MYSLDLCYVGIIAFRLMLNNVANVKTDKKQIFLYLEQLGWESLHKRRKGMSKLILLFKGLKGRASIP